MSASSVPASAAVPGYAAPSGASIKIVGVVWGKQQVTDEGVYASLYAHASEGSGFVFSDKFFGGEGGMQVAGKTGTIWYRGADGALRALVGRQGKTHKF